MPGDAFCELATTLSFITVRFFGSACVRMSVVSSEKCPGAFHFTFGSKHCRLFLAHAFVVAPPDELIRPLLVIFYQTTTRQEAEPRHQFGTFYYRERMRSRCQHEEAKRHPWRHYGVIDPPPHASLRSRHLVPCTLHTCKIVWWEPTS